MQPAITLLEQEIKTANIYLEYAAERLGSGDLSPAGEAMYKDGIKEQQANIDSYKQAIAKLKRGGKRVKQTSN